MKRNHSKGKHGRPKGAGAVMAGRVEAPDGLDFFPTPPWAVRAFCEFALRLQRDAKGGSVWEPACGMGHMAVPLAEYFTEVHASDVYPYGFGEVGDFLDMSLGTYWSPMKPVDWIITNPPFNAAKEFLLRAIDCRPKCGIALLLRTAWLESEDRWLDIFRTALAPSSVFVSADRIVMNKGVYVPKGRSATSYSWFVWTMPLRGEFRRPDLDWIPFGARHRFYRIEDAAIGVGAAKERGLL